MFIHEILEDTSYLNKYDVEPMFEEYIDGETTSIETVCIEEACAISETAVGLLEFEQLSLVNEDVLNEGTFKNIFDKIINAIKQVWAKIKAFFANLFKSIMISIGNINKALENIDKYTDKNFTNFEYTGYDWNQSPKLYDVFKNNCSKAIKEQKVLISKIKFQEVKPNSNDNTGRGENHPQLPGGGNHPQLPGGGNHPQLPGGKPLEGKEINVHHFSSSKGHNLNRNMSRGNHKYKLSAISHNGKLYRKGPNGGFIMNDDTELFQEGSNDIYNKNYKLTEGQQLGMVFYGSPKEVTEQVVQKEIKAKYRKSENKVNIKNFNKGESLKGMIDFLRGFNKNKTLTSAQANANEEFKELLSLCDEAKSKSEAYLKKSNSVGKTQSSTASANLVTHCQVARSIVNKYNHLMSVLIGLEKEKFNDYKGVVSSAVRYNPKEA